MIIGMDFGTTNTGAATYDGNSIHLLPIDPASPNPAICRTSIYITRSRDYHLGSAAVNLYFNQNVGRPTRFKKIRVGEIMQVFAELPTFYRDVFVYEDEFSPGRLFLSIKTALRNPNYYGTVFLDNWYSASDLVAIFLMGVKLEIDKHLPAPAKELVLGRPVRFSNDPDEDKVAQSRLLDGAFKAGFEKVYLEYEPVAAALSYEKSVQDKETVLVFDFGGGTLDFTIMEIGGKAERRVLATGGIPVAGDVFDQRLFRVTIPRYLGENDYFKSGGARYPIPAHIFDLLSSPQEVLSLNTPQNLEMLRSIHQGSLHKEKTSALLRIVSSNYALWMFDRIEQAKRRLSEHTDTQFSFKVEDFTLEETITRKKFERAIQREYEAVRQGLNDILAQAGVTPKEIDRVIRTGGSSQIPLFVRLLHEIFGYQKVQAIDTFSSVTSGLAVRGYEISQGMGDFKAYTPDTYRKSEEMTFPPSQEQELLEISLSSVKQRLEIAREYSEGQAQPPEAAMLTLTGPNLNVLATDSLGSNGAGQQASKREGLALELDLSQASRVIYTHITDQLLAATNNFKLISVPIEAIFIAQQVGGSAIADLLRLEPGEVVTALTHWNPDRLDKRYICMVTRFGQARSFDAKLLAEQVTKKPFFELERRYTGFPIFLTPFDEAVIIGTSAGRLGRAAHKDMAVVPYDLLKARKAEEITAAAAYYPDTGLFALNDQGSLIPFQPADLPVDVPPAARGQTLRKNFRIVGILPAENATGQDFYAVTTQGRIHRLQTPEKGLTPNTPAKVLSLRPGEKIMTCITLSPANNADEQAKAAKNLL